MAQRDIRYQGAGIQDDHVLLLYVHDRSSGEHFWAFPGGGREDGETVENCVRRELWVETGLEVAVHELLFVTPDIPGGCYHWLHTYRCQSISGTAQPGREPEDDTDDHVTIQQLAWSDLRTTAAWDRELLLDPLTFALLQQLRQVLGYTEQG